METFDPRPPLRELLSQELGDQEVRALEAGCGSFDHLEIPPGWFLSGVDISPEALARNPRIDERIVGDLQTIALDSRFDVVFCWDVLEHVGDPEAVLRNLARALVPGGLLVIGVPVRSSFKGWVTRLTPHWFHVAYYRHVMKWENAGQPGERPFPTPMRKAMEPDKLKGLLAELDVTEIWGTKYAAAFYGDILKKYGLVSLLARIGARLVSFCSLGRVDRRCSDYVGVLQRGSK
ncbi:MAG: hypothetical protein CMJ83_09430 [Planctomycetes bacterium]|nr:hypothetical protein [Planctomycetota bacterium]